MQRRPHAIDARSSAIEQAGIHKTAHVPAREPDAALHGRGSVTVQSPAVESTLARHSAAGSFEDQGAISAVLDTPSSGLSQLQVVPDEDIARLFAE